MKLIKFILINLLNPLTSLLIDDYFSDCQEIYVAWRREKIIKASAAVLLNRPQMKQSSL